MAEIVGSTISFVIALFAVLLWLILGPSMDFSERWMITFNTGICVITFLMVFLIQNAQNRNAKALHLKINELIRGVEGSRTELVNLEQRTDMEMRELDQEFSRVAAQACREVDDAKEQVRQSAARTTAIPKKTNVE